MQDIPQLATPHSPIVNFISAASESRYLIMVESMGHQGLSALLFDGLNWRRIDSPSTLPYVYYDFGETDTERFILVHKWVFMKYFLMPV